MKKKLRIKVYLVFWLIIIAFFASIIYFQWDNYLMFSKEAESINKLIKEEEKKSEMLSQELKTMGTDAFVEKIAKEQLGLVSPDEVLFYRE